MAAGRLPDKKPRVGWRVAIGLTALFFFTMQFYVMPTGSMENTLLAGVRLLVKTVAKEPRAGDLVVIHDPADRRQTFVKRVVGLPGDRIRPRHKQLFRNGAPVTEAQVIHKTSNEEPYRRQFPTRFALVTGDGLSPDATNADGKCSEWRGGGARRAVCRVG